ncbi:hypothetical protein L198_01700 [Cryptococcus wingfieldii CBS 7118]|uniref:Uncharacterized protein n=1 Tax=Cryptococcus wingfieldii CBS 7118 TaxID=1295528 RepID=A0A1E3K006_9TREE|nr:hypothetical protein L198_01700 [Cryptococcus wingfieldii CBS 7118]ODO06468.1 hypothetical protein L198_01700 [Cryptococcus wingfieldii CBS 7118]
MGKWQHTKYDKELASKFQCLFEATENCDRRRKGHSKGAVSDRAFRLFVQELDPNDAATQDWFLELLRRMRKPSRRPHSLGRSQNPETFLHDAGEWMMSPSPPLSLQEDDQSEAGSHLSHLIQDYTQGPIAVPSSSRFPSPERRQRMAVPGEPSSSNARGRGGWRFAPFVPHASRDISRLVRSPLGDERDHDTASTPGVPSRRERSPPVSDASLSWLAGYNRNAPSSDPRPLRPLPVRSTTNRPPIMFPRNTRDLLGPLSRSGQSSRTASPSGALRSTHNALVGNNSHRDPYRAQPGPSSQSSDTDLRAMSDHLATALRRRRTHDEIDGAQAEPRTNGRQRTDGPSGRIEQDWRVDDDAWRAAEAEAEGWGRDTRRDGVVFDSADMLGENGENARNVEEGGNTFWAVDEDWEDMGMPYPTRERDFPPLALSHLLDTSQYDDPYLPDEY